MSSANVDTRVFQQQLLRVLREIRDELHTSNQLSRETNSKFDNEDAKLSEQVDEAIQQNRAISLGLKELNRNVEEI